MSPKDVPPRDRREAPTVREGHVPQAPTLVGDASLAGEPPPVAADDARTTPPGYTYVEVLGRGGMGEVVLARDEEIGRDVAIKRMRKRDEAYAGLTTDAMSEAEVRFLREAKIQARLQHPAIPPVHELGRDPDGQPYFTMKRLSGVTLEKLLGETSPRVLRAFVDVCLAIEFAHEHGVIHRDVKPSNIMLGDFGEVYVLDWGVARVMGEGALRPSVEDIAPAEGETAVGAVLGTPGYMAPEQALGYAMSPKIDVYALGCVLFEILAHEPLHPRGTGGAANAIAHPTEAPSVRRPDLAIAPELDAACVAALAEEPEHRPTARELAQRVEAYLDGDRDLERRRDLAAAHLAHARQALESGDPTNRAKAVHAAGRALALDPESADAAELVSALILQPPEALPPALVESLEDSERAAYRMRARTAVVGFASVLPFAGLIPFLVVRSWPLVFGFFGSIIAMIGILWAEYRRGQPIVPLTLVGTFVTMVFMSRVASPFILTPVVACGITLAFYAIPWLMDRSWVVMVWLCAGLLAPIALEALGVLDRTWWLEGGRLQIQSAVVHAPQSIVMATAVTIANLVFVAIVAAFARTTNRERRRAEHRLQIQAWHLRQLLPSHALPA